MEKPARNILFTFDYELFLGSKSGTATNCSIIPTDRLIGIFDKYGIRNVIFFVDTTYLLRLREQTSEACRKDLEMICNQLRNLVAKRHYVFPHIHPHWLDAVYKSETNQWSLNDYSKYRFHLINDTERDALFDQSVKLLHDIVAPENPSYIINSYRAGGWCIQPFGDFKALFLKHGIKHEFSVIKNFKNFSDAQYFDFSDAPPDNVYDFEDEVCVKKEGGSFREYTISSMPVSSLGYFMNKVWLKYLWKRGYRSMGDGTGLVIKSKEILEGKADLIGSANREMVSVELLNSIKLPGYKRFLRQNNYMHFISHPKMLSEHNLNCLDRFLNYATGNFELETDFIKIK